ncbi:MAG: hypothetical protein ACE5LX_00710 [Nitrospinota bacterium]
MARFALVGLLFVIAGLSPPLAKALERNPAGYPLPNIYSSKFLGLIRRDLTERIHGPETIFKQYEDVWGFQFETFSIRGKILGYNLDLDGRFPYDITLFDLDCDGVFETKYDPETHGTLDMPIPECIFRWTPPSALRGPQRSRNAAKKRR